MASDDWCLETSKWVCVNLIVRTFLVWRLQLAQFPSVALLETVTEGMGSKTFPLKFLDNVSDDRL